MLQWHGGAAPYFAASNIFSQTTPGHTRVTASAVTEPQARSTFVITRPSGAAAASSDNTVRYGQRICFASNPLLHIMDPATGTVGLQFLLASQWGSAVKGRQECTATQTRSANTEWTVTPASGDMLVAEGNPVFAGDKITLVHAMSGTPVSDSWQFLQLHNAPPATLSHALPRFSLLPCSLPRPSLRLIPLTSVWS